MQKCKNCIAETILEIKRDIIKHNLGFPLLFANFFKWSFRQITNLADLKEPA